MSTSLVLLCYDNTALDTAQATAFQIVNHHTAAKLPQPPNNHVISILTVSFQLAVQENDIDYLRLLLRLHNKFMKSSLDYVNYDLAALHTAQSTAIQLIY